MTGDANTVTGRAGAEAEARRPASLAGRPAGWRIVAAKELGDHVRSVRFVVLVLLLALAAAGTVYAASGTIRDVAPEATGEPALFLRVFTLAGERLPAFYALIGFLAPLLGIAFGFDAVNGERSQGTLPRLLSQPIYRDDVINGKFAAGLALIAALATAIVALVSGVALLRLGVVPSADQVARLLVWLLVLSAYVAFWLGLATLCSVALRRAATSALAAISVWIVVTLFTTLLVGLVAGVISPVPADATFEERLANARTEETLSRLSPTTLYQEATAVLLNPQMRAIGVVLPEQLDRAVRGTLPLDQSLLLVWPQMVALIALTVVCFAIAYVLFMRQEVRA